MESQPRILIIDDEAVVCRSCEKVLESEGYDVTTTLSASDALNTLEREPYDLVFTDLKMPDVHGIDVLRRIKEFSPDTGVIIMTGYSTPDTSRKAEKLGASGYLLKPLTPFIMLEAARKALVDLKKEGAIAEEDKPSPKGPEEITEEQWEKIDEIVMSMKERPGALIPVLQQVQEYIGFLSPDVQKRIAKGLEIPSSEVLSVVSFYSFFTMVPRGKFTIRVCLGTACYVKGGNKILGHLQGGLGIKVGETTEDRLFTLEAVRCLGACGLAPAMIVGNNVHGRIDPPKVMDVLEGYKITSG
jgi:NADH-quinone oxidoreductase subunit E/NADP-reducing hydrogenase subunit HndA